MPREANLAAPSTKLWLAEDNLARDTFPSMAEIVLSTLNARYVHASFGLRYLFANLGTLQPRAKLLEFDINQRALDIAEKLLAENASIIGLGVYIWNVKETTEVLSIFKRISPKTIVILGGPEVSYETETHPITALADYVITGEADLKFAEICAQLLQGGVPGKKIIPAELPEFHQLAAPYNFYTDEDVAHRVVYVEASRGCPFTCEFCLSSLDIPVRQVALVPFLVEMEKLLTRGVRQFKFVDRTFNLNLNTSRTLLEFFLERYQPGHFFHFEMVPDRLPEALREVIAKFPPGALQFEVGIQTFNTEVGTLIKRRQDYDKLADNLRFLRSSTGVHIHADLIIGLPGEDTESFGRGFDRLLALKPQEIQVGILKLLRGTPISRHDVTWAMNYGSHPPYEILENKLIPFAQMQRLRRFAKFWDLVGNSGNFIRTAPLLWKTERSAFQAFLQWSDWVFEKLGRTDSIALGRLIELIFIYLTEVKMISKTEVAEAVWSDYQRGGRNDKLHFLAPYLSQESTKLESTSRPSLPRRQARHIEIANS